MGATASVQLLSWQQLAELAEAARQPPVVADTIRRYKLDAATALEMEERDVAKLKPRLKPLEKLKVVAALSQLGSFTHRADGARARLAALAKDKFGGIRPMFESLEIWDVLDDATARTSLSRSTTGRRPRERAYRRRRRTRRTVRTYPSAHPLRRARPGRPGAGALSPRQG